jgi:glycosyltransferase 2 family protein
MHRRRLVQTIILMVGLAGIAWAITRTVDEAQEQVLPSASALAIGALLALAAIVSSARAWVALFSDLVPSRASRSVLRGTFYLSQLTKYLPAGGVVQAASQLGLAPSAGVPLKRAAVAYPVSAVGAVAAGATLASPLAMDTDLPAWVRVLAALGLATVGLLHRGLMARALGLARRAIHRVPTADQLPTQRDILMFYLWALLTIGSLCGTYVVLLHSLNNDSSALTTFSAFAASWVLGFVAVPIPAGIGIREAVLVGLLPGVPTAQLLSASLALRLLTIGTELLAMSGNRMLLRRHVRLRPPEQPAETVIVP